jgi:DNA-binding NtrC family response regulator
MSKMLPILIVSGASQSRDGLAQVASKCELRPVCCETLAAAKALMTRQQFALVVCEDSLPDGNFHAIVGEGTRRRGKQPVIVVSSRDDWGYYLRAMRAGVFDCLSSSSNTSEVERILAAALQEYRRSAEMMAQPEVLRNWRSKVSLEKRR